MGSMQKGGNILELNTYIEGECKEVEPDKKPVSKLEVLKKNQEKRREKFKKELKRRDKL